ncbi:GtrA family protein [Streptomyces violaceus]|uniref:GtrA family protein n=1 Tax=Streptomyces violaceus TaxID=1936 RepID=UPI00380726CB
MAAQSRQQAAPGAFTAFARFVLCGGVVGLASSFAVAALASWIPWVVANALITAVSTLIATELHARFTFRAGGRATWRQHAQSAGSAAAAYAVTCAAMLGLHQLVAAPSAVLEQVAYLSACALAGAAQGRTQGRRASVPAVSASQPMPSTQPARRQTECAYAPDYRPDHGRSAHYNASPGAVC